MEKLYDPEWEKDVNREEPGRAGRMLETIHPRKVFFITQEVMVNIMIVYIIVVLAAGLGKTLMDARHLVHMVGGVEKRASGGQGMIPCTP